MRLQSMVLLLGCVIFLASETAQAQEAAAILKQAGITRGVCCVLGAGDGKLVLDLAKQSQMLIHVLEPDAEKVKSLRKTADEAGYSIQRILVEQAKLDKLPHADNTLDLLIAEDAGLYSVDRNRAVRPEGKMFFGLSGSKIKLRMTKAVPKGIDEWSHWEKSPDNNPVSEDQHIKAPYMTQFMATPYYIGMPSITTAAGGRTFLAMGHIAHHEREWGMLNRLIARNGYNGTILWERKLPEDYLVHRSAFVATRETFHMIAGDHCLLLDAQTGKETGKISIPNFQGDWKWIAFKDGILYALAGAPGDGVELVKGNRAFGGWSWADLSKGYYGKRIPHGFGDVIAAFDVKQKKLLWMHREKTLIDSRGLAILDDQFFLYCPDRHFRCLNRKTGKVEWTNDEKLTLGLIEQPGKGLTSTPGWRTQTMVVATPKALVVQGQTRMNVVGLSTKDGSLLWQKDKVTNNPNGIFVDGKVVLAVGQNGSHLVIDPESGTVEDDLKFFKRACTRLTGCPDSFFVRGEGMTRFDRISKTVKIDGAVRPACNDGVIPAHGLIYLGPWACDCNLSLIGNVARCSAGDFPFNQQPDKTTRLEVMDHDKLQVLEITEADWPTYRGNLKRSNSTTVPAQIGKRLLWRTENKREFLPTEATAVGELIFHAGDDGKVRAINAQTGKLKWEFQTGGPMKSPPTISNSRAYIGSGDGYVYCLKAANGQLLWRFRAAPVERKVMIYGSLCSTWPVNTGVLVHEGTAYFGAGIVDHDGTHVYALDADSGKVIWENHDSGHLNEDLRKGVSAQGNLTILGDKLVMAGGNVVSPARFDLKTGYCMEPKPNQGHPQKNGGKFLGSLGDNQLIAGGRILYSSPRNVSTKGSFQVWTKNRESLTLNFGGIPPAWNEDL